MNRNEFMELLKTNKGLIFIKFGAEWCAPCKTIDPYIEEIFEKLTSSRNDEITCLKIDIDESFDLYAFLKSKKMVNGIPAILCYEKGNETYIPLDSISGTNKSKIDYFFKNSIEKLDEL